MIIGAVTETFPGESRVALTPAAVRSLREKEAEVLVEPGCGVAAGFADSMYVDAGAQLAANRREVFAEAEILLQVRIASANPVRGREDLPLHRRDVTVIGYGEPLTAREPVEALASTGARSHAIELLPRITRAQSMDALSSQATISGYKAALVAASTLGRLFPMMMTAAGTVPAAKVFVIGAGVAGLQTIATSRRLGAVVSAYDVRSAVREEVQSVGAKFIELALPATNAADKGGYARAMDDTFYRAQREMMFEVVAASDVVITTAVVPGRRAPILVTRDMVERMPAGAVIVDLAAERGGNCELTRPDETVHHQGVTILGPTNLPATVAGHASQLFARNLVAFVVHLQKVKEGGGDGADEIVDQTLLTRDGRVASARVREILGIDLPAESGAERSKAS